MRRVLRTDSDTGDMYCTYIHTYISHVSAIQQIVPTVQTTRSHAQQLFQLFDRNTAWPSFEATCRMGERAWHDFIKGDHSTKCASCDDRASTHTACVERKMAIATSTVCFICMAWAQCNNKRCRKRGRCERLARASRGIRSSRVTHQTFEHKSTGI